MSIQGTFVQHHPCVLHYTRHWGYRNQPLWSLRSRSSQASDQEPALEDSVPGWRASLWASLRIADVDIYSLLEKGWL